MSDPPGVNGNMIMASSVDGEDPTLNPARAPEYHGVPGSGDAQGVGLGGAPRKGFRITFTWNGATRKKIVQACYMGVAAIFGTLLRMVLAQLFGEECKNPGTVGWLASDSALCVTASGDTTQEGGIIFADLPANMLGSMIMGLMQSGDVLDLAVHAPIAWLSPTSAFQGYDTFHLAIKTGFCGSLTTFSSWNSEMVIMLVGEGVTNRHSQIWRAIFGYIIGIEVALGSYVFGQTLARWLHKWRNPTLKEEAKAMAFRKSQGIYINHYLPEFERRFLHDLPMSVDVNAVEVPGLGCLSAWRLSTEQARHVGHPMLQTLWEIETVVFVERAPIPRDHFIQAREQGWEVDALQEYLTLNNIEGDFQVPSKLTPTGIRKTESEHTFRWFRVSYAVPLFVLALGVLTALLVTLDDETAYRSTYRTMVYAMLFSAPGALLRWKLSSLNGTFTLLAPRLTWLALGTLTANVLGAMVSIAMIGTEYRLAGNGGGFWMVGSLRAIKVGFAGCLTTVSTFISEVHNLTKVTQDRAYKYILLTLGISGIVSIALFCILVYV